MSKVESEKWYWTVPLVGLGVAVVLLAAFTNAPNAVLTGVSVLVLLLAWALLVLSRNASLGTGKPESLFPVAVVVSMGLGIMGSEWMQMLLFVCYPLVFIVSRRLLTGVIWAWALTAAVAIGLLYDGTATWEVLWYSLVVGSFATAMGVWISRIWEWGVERERMRSELASSQEQLLTVTGQQATQAERERIAREVHDTLAQGYVAIIALAQSPGTRPQIELVARENLAEARALINAWRSPALEDRDLTEALSRLAASSDANFEGGAEGVPVEIETSLYRAAGEALHNVRRHAGASNVLVQLEEDSEAYILRVSDDGVGMGEAVEGNGLSGMRERAAMLGGSVAITSGNGTTVCIRIPKEAPLREAT